MDMAKEENERIICACCKKDITNDYLREWIGDECFCYVCAKKRVKRKGKNYRGQNDIGGSSEKGS